MGIGGSNPSTRSTRVPDRMSVFWPLLRDGLRLSLLLPPRKVQVTVVYWPLLAFIALAALVSLPYAWVMAEAPRQFDPEGLQGLLAGLALALLSGVAMARLVQRPALTLTVASWLVAACLLPTLIAAIPFVLLHESWVAQMTLWVVALIWVLAIYVRLAVFLAPNIGRALGAAAATFAVSVLPWLAMTQNEFISTDWAAYHEQDLDEEDADTENAYRSSQLETPETTFYAQGPLLDAALNALAPQRPGHIDMYVLGFGSDASEGAFRNEVDFLPALAASRLDAQGRALRLVNHAGSADSVPLATVTNLERALAGIGERMDLREDVLFLYLTSHGSEDHSLYVNQPPLPLRQLTPATLRKALDDAGIRWRVIVVSACYSGGYVDVLADPRTLIVTAARADRTSFGCGNSANATWFGQAFLIDGLNHTASFRRAFLRARKQVAQREQAEDYTASEPQWRTGEAISEHLTRWRETLPPGQPAAFTPSVQVADGGGDAPIPAQTPPPDASDQE